ncbi:MAG: RloB family protein, partial [Erysipelotrichaceae bacterium]|nr:RloB family protein [Erysipelotrichaceae bacterium]
FDKIIEEAKNYGIEAGWSNPCFEIWLFAYFGEMPNIPDSKQCCKKFAEAYNKRTRQKYEKSEENIYGKMCDYGDEEKAFSVARQKRKQFDKDSINIPSEMVPCTRVDILVKEIKDKIKSN